MLFSIGTADMWWLRTTPYNIKKLWETIYERKKSSLSRASFFRLTFPSYRPNRLPRDGLVGSKSVMWWGGKSRTWCCVEIYIRGWKKIAGSYCLMFSGLQYIFLYLCRVDSLRGKSWIYHLKRHITASIGLHRLIDCPQGFGEFARMLLLGAARAYCIFAPKIISFVRLRLLFFSLSSIS